MNTLSHDREIRPALSPRMWSALMGNGLTDTRLAAHEEGNLAVAAVALFEHPQGFTWTDYDMLMNMAQSVETEAGELDGTARGELARSSYTQRAADIRNLAARIGALLAPR